MQIFLLLVAFLGLAYLGVRRVAPEITDKVETAVTDKLDDLVEYLEGYRADAYQDQAGVWTIGYGHQIVKGDGFYHPSLNPTGRKTLTEPEARALKEADEKIAKDAIAKFVKVPLTENQYAALASLIFNIGVGAFSTSTLLRLLNQYRYEEAAAAFKDWNKITKNGLLVVDPILVSRRKRESELFLTA